MFSKGSKGLRPGLTHTKRRIAKYHTQDELLCKSTHTQDELLCKRTHTHMRRSASKR